MNDTYHGRVRTMHNTPKGRAALKPGDFLHFGIETGSRDSLRPISGLFARFDGENYVLDDRGIVTIVPFSRVRYVLRAALLTRKRQVGAA